MTDSPTRNLNVMPEMRALAEHSVEQAKSTFDDLMAATQRAVSTVEDRTAAAQATARELHGQAMGFAERNVAAWFDFAQELLRAKDAEHMLKLHADFMASQMQALTEQARELTRQAAAAAGNSGQPRA